MQTIHAPWRIGYILGPKGKGCFLCVKRTRGYQRRHLILRETAACYVLLNKYPYSAAHVMVVPKRHIADLDGFTSEELVDFITLTRDTARVLKRHWELTVSTLALISGRLPGPGLRSISIFTLCRAGTGIIISCRCWAKRMCCRNILKIPIRVYCRILSERRALKAADVIPARYTL